MTQIDPLRFTAPPDRLAYRLREFCQLAGIGTTKAYAEVRSGRLRIRKSGRNTLVLAGDAAAYLAALPDRADPEPSAAREGRDNRRRAHGHKPPTPSHPLATEKGVTAQGSPERAQQNSQRVTRNGRRGPRQ
jgi:hypothetical protein